MRRGYEDSAHQLELINRSTSRYLQQTGYPVSRRALPTEPTAIERPPISDSADLNSSTSD